MSTSIEMKEVHQDAPTETQTPPAPSVDTDKDKKQEGKEETVENKPPAWKRLLKRWFITAFSGMAMGLFCTLIAGLIIKQIGELIGRSNRFGWFFFSIGQLATILTGGGIGAGIANALDMPRLVVFCSIVTGFVGANSSAIAKGTFIKDSMISTQSPGDPIGAYLGALSGAEIGRLVVGTKIDIILVPLVSLLSGSTIGYFSGPPVSSVMQSLGNLIDRASQLQPVPTGMIVAVIMGLLLTLPTSSAAIGIAIGMKGISAGAAVAGCASHMIGFAIASFGDNGVGGLIAQGVGTSMLQIPNVFAHPQILIPPTIAAMISGPISAAAFKLECNSAGSGMGTAGFVGTIMTWTESRAKGLPTGQIVWGIVVCQFVIPAVVSYLVFLLLRKVGWIKDGYQKIAKS